MIYFQLISALVLFVLAATLLVKACGPPVRLSLETLLETAFPWALLILAIVVSIVMLLVYYPLWWVLDQAREIADARRIRLAAPRGVKASCTRTEG